MAIEQTILFTLVPRGISLDSANKPVSVFVSPRLDGADHLGAFPDWLNWTHHLRNDGMQLELQCSQNKQVFPINGAGLRPDLWQQLFNADTYVRSHQSFDDYSQRGLISFSMRESLSALKAVYQKASVTLALPDPPRRGRQDDRITNRQRLADLVDGFQVHWDGWDGRNARWYRDKVRERYASTQLLTQESEPLDSEGLLIEPPLDAVAGPFSVFHHMPTPDYGPHGIELPDRAKLLDFHQAITSLNSYPELLRALGLVFDLDLPNGFVSSTPYDQPGTMSVLRALPGWKWAQLPRTHPMDTAYIRIVNGHDDLFFAAPRSAAPQRPGVDPAPPGQVLGLLNLDPAHFGLAQVDVDGGMHKAIMLAETLHPSGEHNLKSDAGPQPAQHPEVFDPEATLASLRSGGVTLFADNRALQLLQSIQEAKSFNQALSGNQPPNRPFFAEDLVRGYRLDVWDSRTNAWHSLHQRNGQYTVGDVPFKPVNEPEEGFVELAVTQPAPNAKNHDNELYLHEAIARWAGWSLSVTRPGKHLSRYANAKDALPRPGEGDKFLENQPETPFRVASDYKLVPGSLPSLRFGVRYRLRARAVDLAGNSLQLNDKLTDLLANTFALPRDPEGFAYLRFEPVPAPLVVIRDESAVTAPGSAVDRLVIRTFNDDVSKDTEAADTANADRHIIPARAAIEMGERLGTFDDATGKLKSDAATWKLIGDRDLGELQKKKIIIKGRTQPVPDDGSSDYPVEPGDSINPLPFFPDPLSHGAALRDLPGTPSGAIGRVFPDAGVSAPVDYQQLSDPNPRPGSATLISFGESGQWEQTRGFRFVLAEPLPNQANLQPYWDPQGRVLTVFLPKGQTRVIPLTSYLTPQDLKLMGIWQWLREYIDQLVQDPLKADLHPGSDIDRIAHILQRAVEGGHWMLTPPHLLTLVHAVQQPVGHPQFTGAAIHHEQLANDLTALQTTPGRGQSDPSELASVTAWRRPGSTESYLLGALKVHGASTGRIDLLATWDDPIDDISRDKWTTVHHAGPLDDLPLSILTDGYLDVTDTPGSAGVVGGPPAQPQDRHVGYYDSLHDQILFVRASDNTTWEDRGFTDAAPRHVLHDTKHHRVNYTAIASSRYREYFDPGLDASAFTRSSEPVVVDVPASARPLAPDVVYVVPTFGWERQTDTNLKRSVRFGGGLRVYLNRPWFSSGQGELLGVALWSYENGSLDDVTRDKFKPFFTQWGMDPIWQTADLSDAPDVFDFPDADDSEFNLSLEEASARLPDGSPGRISVAGFTPQYDVFRKLWFADLTVNLPSETYMPFVRLALVRYQPRALANAKVSRVVLADFAQLTPDRSAMVTADPYHPRTLRVVVSGVAPRGPVPIIQARQMPEHVSPRATQISVRVQQHDAAFTSELAWSDVMPDVARVFPSSDGPVAGKLDLALWAGTVQFATKPVAGKFRLLIEEHEFISANFVSIKHGVIQQPGRLIYAEIVLIDEALVKE